MAARRLAYLAALLGSVVFYWAYREWLSWMFMMILMLLPWFSLLVSLPAMLRCRGRVLCPAAVSVHTDTEVSWQGYCRHPLSYLEGKLVVRHAITGQTMKLKNGDLLPTDHCGKLHISLHRPVCCDYLGLFSLPIRKRSDGAVLVRPEPLAVEKPPDMSRYQICAWKPKAGGGYSENHELRLYRPGDNLRQVHWKLSAKTGKLIIREPMEAVQNRLLLTMELRGTGEELDRKLGNLQWMSSYLLQCELPHRIHVLTGDGLVLYSVLRETDVQPAIDDLLGRPAAAEDAVGEFTSANWRYHIGGDGSAD